MSLPKIYDWELEKPDTLDDNDWLLRAREVKTADLQFFSNE